MDRRMVLAIVLMLIVALLPSILFPRRRPAPAPGPEAPAPGPEGGDAAAPAIAAVPPAPAEPAPGAVPERRVRVESELYRLEFSSRGARLVATTLEEYRRNVAADDTVRVQLIPAESRFMEYAIVFRGDTLSLAEWSFVPSDSVLRVTQAGTRLEWEARRGPATVRLTYAFRPDQYMFDVAGEVSGVGPAGLVLVRLGPRLAFVDADSADDFRAYAVVAKASRTESTPFSGLEPGEQRALEGPFEWVAVKSKYFVAAVLTVGEGEPRLGGALVSGGERIGRYAARADVVATLPAPGGAFGHSVYVGPQEFRRLARIGHDFQDVNPYGWVFRPVIRPFGNLIVRILLWMHETLNLAYGWVLVLFGVAVRLLLWPLNQTAMRSSMALQALQPEVKALQERYRGDPQRLQQETMRLYREHRVNPMGGCLPMLLPMPVLFALFFVFRETIEFRGVPFLWLPDLSRHDPYYVIPLLMGLSMYVLARLGQIGIPPTPQAKMMLYAMPGLMTVLFLKFSSGLNLYYAVSNVASIPQQWLVARERRRRTVGRPP